MIKTTEQDNEDLRRLFRQEREARERAERERDELRRTLHSLLLEAECYAGISKHLMQECEEAEQLINRLKGDK